MRKVGWKEEPIVFPAEVGATVRSDIGESNLCKRDFSDQTRRPAEKDIPLAIRTEIRLLYFDMRRPHSEEVPISGDTAVNVVTSTGIPSSILSLDRPVSMV